VSLIFVALLPYENILTTKFSQITVMQVVANIFQYQKCSCGTASSVSIPVSSIISFGSVTASRMGVESSAEWPPPCNCCNWPFLFWLAFLLIDPAVWLYTCPFHSHHDLQLEQQQYINMLMYCDAGKYTILSVTVALY